MAALKQTVRVILCATLLPFLGERGQAFDLGVYAQGGFDMVSSKPPSGGAATVSSPAPTGPSYGVGISSEFIKFADNMIGLGALIGFGGVSASWKSSETGKSPSAVEMSAMGIDITGRALVHFGDFRAFGYAGLLYGLFGNSYKTTLDGNTTNPDGEILNYAVSSVMRVTAGFGLGYEMGDLAFDVQGGFNSISLNVTTPERGTVKSSNVTDTYTGFTFGAVASYRFMGGAPAAPVEESKKQHRTKKSDSDNKNPSKKKKKKKKKDE
jgi:hypothetical protein